MFKKSSIMWAVVATAMFSIPFSSCSKIDESSPESVNTRATNVITVSGVINSNTTWTSDNEYHLDGKVFVTPDANGAAVTLTINPGTKIVGLNKSEADSASALIITRGAKIDAQGTASSPIIMTASNGTKGGWGGLVLLGRAPINQVDQLIEGINTTTVPVPAGVNVNYGGGGIGLGTSTDNSGTLKYVRVEYAGASISDANELNSFTFGGVGSGTTLEHLQAYYGADDAFEFFGGCVNAKYLISTAADDDAFDFDFGFTGKLQFLVATINPLTSYSSDPNGIECDNDKLADGTGSTNQPFTHPYISNLTFAGTSNGLIAGGGISTIVDSITTHSLKSGANFRRNCQFTLVNSILYGAPKGILLQTSNSYSLENNVVCAVPSMGVNFATFTASTTNTGLTAYSGITLTSPFGDYYNTSALQPTENTPAYDGNNYDAASLNSFFVNTDYKGGANNAAGEYWISDAWVKK